MLTATATGIGLEHDRCRGCGERGLPLNHDGICPAEDCRLLSLDRCIRCIRRGRLTLLDAHNRGRICDSCRFEMEGFW